MISSEQGFQIMNQIGYHIKDEQKVIVKEGGIIVYDIHKDTAVCFLMVSGNGKIHVTISDDETHVEHDSGLCTCLLVVLLDL